MIIAKSRSDFAKYVGQPSPDDLYVYGCDINTFDYVFYKVKRIRFLEYTECFILSTSYFRLIAPKDSYLITIITPAVYLNQINRNYIRKIKPRNSYLGMPIIASFDSIDKNDKGLTEGKTFFIDNVTRIVATSNISDFGVILELDSEQADVTYVLDNIVFGVV